MLIMVHLVSVIWMLKSKSGFVLLTICSNNCSRSWTIMWSIQKPAQLSNFMDIFVFAYFHPTVTNRSPKPWWSITLDYIAPLRKHGYLRHQPWKYPSAFNRGNASLHCIPSVERFLPRIFPFAPLWDGMQSTNSDRKNKTSLFLRAWTSR